MYRYRRARRRGVLLLIVLCVLFMFLLLAITYTVVASKEHAMTRNYARYERTGDPPNVVLDQLAMMLFRDTNDPHSPFRSWSLLEGIYGNVSFRGTISGTPTPQAGGQFLQFTPSSLNNVTNYYKGCVLTMLTGQCAGLSTRIVASSGGSSPSLTVMRFQADAGLYDPASGDTYLINGRPYSGMGRGYNTTTTNTGPANNAMDPNNWPYALLPNPFGFQASGSYSDPAGPGGDNMDYTACDYNNCYLGLMLNTPTGQSGAGIIPSFFRPALYSYWENQPNGPTSTAQGLRKISFRPNKLDNSVFCNYTNPNFTPDSPTSSFDVDNLGGGIPDSIWIDPGLPAFTTRDGRTAKILVAPCVLDLDGRINVNAHGNILNSGDPYSAYSYSQPPAGATVAGGSQYAMVAGLGGYNGTAATNVQLPMGQGYGTAEINLSGIFSKTEITNLLTGYSASPVGWSGRYGNSPGGSSSGWSVLNAPLEWVKLFEFPLDVYTFDPTAPFDDPRALRTSFMSPPDLKGRRVAVVDPRGQMTWATPGSNPNSTTTPYFWNCEVQAQSPLGGESPYAFNLGRGVARTGRYIGGASGYDNPFTVGELETILRQYDVDFRSLPQRLYSLLPSVQPSNALFNSNQRNKLTTDSWDLPVPNFQVPRYLRSSLTSGNQAFGITDLVNAKFQQNCPGLVGNSAEMAKILAPELIAGLRMDINRPFGDGRLNNSNPNIGVDSPGGISSPGSANTNYVAGAADASPESLTTIANVSSSSGYRGVVPFNLVNGSSTTSLGADPVLSKNLPAGVQARQLMARHLYALMMLFADQGFYGWTAEAGLTPQQYQQLTARRIAQWAINVVSFRDATSIMTPFMYQWDIYQSSYQGWMVDGDPGNTSQASQNYGVVWACKPPDALLTETVAFHDKRIGDTAWDTGNNGTIASKPPDQGGNNPGSPNFDQVRIPQGSTFIEIYCARNPNISYAPGDLYTANQNIINNNTNLPVYCLDLGRMAPDNSPVWRLAISQSRISNPNCDLLTATAPNSPSTHPDTTTFEPTTDPAATGQPWQQMNLFNAGLNVPIERIVWLGQTPPTAAQRASLSPGWIAAPGAQIYYNRTGSTLVAPGSYALIGPRATTYIGAAGTKNTTTQWGKPSSAKITIAATSITATDPNGASTMPTNGTLKTSPFEPVGMVCAADVPPATLWTNATAYAAQSNSATGGVGLNISEPLPTPATVGATTSTYYPQPIWYNSLILPAKSVYDAYDDLTQTTHEAGATGYLDQPLEETGSTLTTCPLLKDSISKTGTTTNYRTVFLQRLADPTSGYDALRNPYITVDWMPIDLTVFNGEDLPTNPNPNDAGAAAPSVNFSTRQRGGSNPTGPAGAMSFNIWSPVQSNDTLGAPTTVTSVTGIHVSNFPYKLNHTFGSLNQGFFSAANPALTATAGQYQGDPAHPFPLIAWNARPYASTLELLNVPASSPDRLLFEFSSPDTAAPGTGITSPFGTSNVYSSGQTNVRAPFGYLLNFFNSSPATSTQGTAWNLYRALEYLQVPSRFIGCETLLNPTYFTANASGSTNMTTQYFLPPFNSVSNYRDPGRMNLNTITDAGVWSCVMNGMTLPTYGQLCDSRRSDGASYNGTTITAINPAQATTQPTYFGNVFRSAAGSDLVPVSQMVHSGVNATLLRAGTSTPDSATAPLFAGTATNADYNSATRNPYFAYQGLERLSNLVTTRSNVFGVWLTIGYFEAVPTASGAPDAGHPDGYQLGEEIGSDTGEVERHRAFYIFDRSIPVGYERGQNHNVNRAILLKRYIE